ncbi:Polypyrimidine tract-binding protein 2 [Balamuthia mandrillaris]
MMSGTQEDFSYDGSDQMNKGKSGENMPSPVVHVRNLPQDCSEQEITAIACPFGRVERVFMLKGKNQAFVQMQDLQTATALVQYYSQVQGNIRGRPCYFQYSNRNEITTTPEDEQPNHILLVSVLNLAYPVTIDTLYQVFSKFGAIVRIIIFNKKGFQALVEFADKSAAQNARESLDGQNIYSGCCTLSIKYSRLPTLTVRYNNDKTRDFTNPSLPSGGDPSGGPSAAGPAGAAGMGPAGMFPDSNPYAPYGYPPQYAAAAKTAAAGMGPAGMAMGAMRMPGMPHAAGMGMGGPTVLIVSNLTPERILPDHIFTLFGVYGDVLRVKILYNKPDTALVQFASPHGAETALSHLNGLPLHGKNLLINFSKHNSISLPRDAQQEGSHLTKDYSGSPLHRYKVQGSKNYHHICSPSPVLHISNIPIAATEEEVKAPFSQFGTVTGFKFFSKDKRMALLEMSSLDEAVEALMNLHDYLLGDHNLRVSFSKSQLQ